MALDPSTPTTLYAGTSLGVFKSTNGGTSWGDFNAGVTIFNILALAIDPLTPATLYAGTSGRGAFAITITERNPRCADTGSFSLRGKVKAKVGDVNPGTTLALTGPAACSETTTTDVEGNYTFTDLADGTYTVVPSKEGCTFKPPHRTVMIAGKDARVKKFQGTCP